MHSHTFQVPWASPFLLHSPSGDPPLERFHFIQSPKADAYSWLKAIILVIACSWKSLDTIGYECLTMALVLKFVTNMLPLVPIPFTDTGNYCSQFQTSQTRNCILSYTKHVISIRFTINWNNLKSYLNGRSWKRYTSKYFYFFSQEFKLFAWRNHHV